MQRSLPWDPIVHDLPQTPLLLSGPSLVVGSANHCQYPENVAWTFQNCRTVNIHTVNDLADHPITCWVKSTANLRLYCDRSYLHSSLNCDKTISIFSVPLSFAQPSPGILLGVVLMSRITGILVNTLRPRQNGRHLPDGIFECIFLNENLGISISISLKFVPRGSINNNPLLVQIKAWRLPGDKPLSEPMMVRLPTHICVLRPHWPLRDLKKKKVKYLNACYKLNPWALLVKLLPCEYRRT